MARIRTRQVKRRKGTCSLWLKRNWVLVMLIFLALVGVFLSIALFLEPCEKKTRTSITTTNVTLNVTTLVVSNVTRNVTRNVTSHFNATFLRNVTLNVTREVNETVTLNVTRNVTVF